MLINQKSILGKILTPIVIALDWIIVGIAIVLEFLFKPFTKITIAIGNLFLFAGMSEAAPLRILPALILLIFLLSLILNIFYFFS